ncbi:MAG: FMN-binding protein [Deltaproteobacteria bacterium]|nr:FMN-binding protein [Deltaproteobacteria bacterium]
MKILNEDKIETNQKVKLQKVIMTVLGILGAEEIPYTEVVQLFDRRVKSVEVKGKTIYIGHSEDGRKLTGYAFPVGGPGFWGPIEGMVAVDPSASKILGISFYKHSETPGLGARVTEPWFTKQFGGLPIHPIQGDKKIFYLKPQGTRLAPNELDAVTGATGTSRAVEGFVNRDLDRFLREMFSSIKKG